MSAGAIKYADGGDFPESQVVSLYSDVGWTGLSGAPERLMKALYGSDAVVSAWDGDVLVGLGNTISDGALAVLFSHLLVRPSHQRRGIGSELARRLQERYASFNHQIVVAERGAEGFYHRLGFRPIEPDASALWFWQPVQPADG